MDKVLYRADVSGLQVGGPTTQLYDVNDSNQSRTHATTNPKVARALTVLRFRLPPNVDLSVYRVELDEPLVLDPAFPSDEQAEFYLSHYGTVVDLYGDDPAMSRDEALAVMNRYAQWPDGSRIWDDNGHATVPPQYESDPRFDDDDREQMRKELRVLGFYPAADAVLAFLRRHHP